MSIEFNDFVHQGPNGDRNPRFRMPRWAWRSVATATAIGLLMAGEVVSALAAIVAFTSAEVVFDAAELER